MKQADKLPWVLTLLKRLRPDLVALQSSLGAQQGEHWLMGWLLSNGMREYAMLREDEEFLDFMRAPGTTPGLARAQQIIYDSRPDLQDAFPLPHRLPDLEHWFRNHGTAEYSVLGCLGARSELPSHEPPRPFGVNLIGYAFGQLGIGEDLRMAASAFETARIPYTIIDFPPGPGVPANDRSVEHKISTEAPYAINIFCLTALEHARFILTHGNAVRRGRYSIGYWPWELSLWPEAWRDLFSLTDEVWVSSRHTYNAIAPECSLPLRLMPMAVHVDNIRECTRGYFNLPDHAHLFCFSFDLNSSMHRKNPAACIKAFQLAFPRGHEKWASDVVGLVVKCHKPATVNQDWEMLKEAAAQDDRIHIMESTLDRDDLLSLYRNCNTFVSLHRAEGFGRGIAEALLLKLNVVTTGYSGNIDFSNNAQTLLVRSNLVPVQEGEYPYSENQVWAEPDIQHAAMRMVESYSRGQTQSRILHDNFSPEAIGNNYTLRLYEIYSTSNPGHFARNSSSNRVLSN